MGKIEDDEYEFAVECVKELKKDLFEFLEENNIANDTAFYFAFMHYWMLDSFVNMPARNIIEINRVELFDSFIVAVRTDLIESLKSKMN